MIGALRNVVRILAGRVRARPEAIRLLVLIQMEPAKHPWAPFQERARTRPDDAVSLEMEVITDPEHPDLDEITAIDEWHTSKAWSKDRLAEGWRCYTAKHDGRIAAVGWAAVGLSFRDTYLERDFKLEPDEAYCTRGFTVASFRGMGVMRRLVVHMMLDLTRSSGAMRAVMAVRATNHAMRRTLTAIGWRRVGRMGFVGVFGMRLHYLVGRQAFPMTKRRTYLDLRRYSARNRAGAGAARTPA